MPLPQWFYCFQIFCSAVGVWWAVVGWVEDRPRAILEGVLLIALSLFVTLEWIVLR